MSAQGCAHIDWDYTLVGRRHWLVAAARCIAGFVGSHKFGNPEALKIDSVVVMLASGIGSGPGSGSFVHT